MKNFTHPILCGVALASALSLSTLPAQEPSPEPPPTKPYVAEPIDGTTWTVTWTYQDSKQIAEDTPTDATPPPQVRRPKSATLIHTKAMTQLAIEWTKGPSSKVFVSADKAMFVSPENGKAYFGNSDRGTLDETTGLFIGGFHGTNWINSQGEYVGTEVIEGRECHVFTMPGRVSVASDDPDAPPLTASLPPARAWIEQGTKFPVRIELEGHHTIDFSPVVRTSEKPKLPGEITELLEKKRKRALALEELKRHSR